MSHRRSTNEQVHLAVALEGAGWHPAAWREEGARPHELTSARYWRELIRTAEGAGLVLATIEDALSFGGRVSAGDEPRTDRVRGRLDAVLLASYLAPSTSRIGLVPTVTTTHPEPFHLATGLQTLDFASQGRAGVRVVAGSSAAERANFGRRTDGPSGAPGDPAQQLAWRAAFREAGEVVDAIRRLADSWEDDAIIRDVASGRFLDRERVHNVEVEGEFFSIVGASIVPRSPQGQPLVTALAHDDLAYRFAAAHADVVFITPADADAVTGILTEIDDAAAEVRTDAERLRVFADVLVIVEDTRAAAEATWERLQSRAALTTDARVVVGTPDDVAEEVRALAAAGVDGVRLRPARLPADLDAIARDVVPRLRETGTLAADDADTLRGRLGLARPVNRYARQEVSA